MREFTAFETEVIDLVIWLCKGLKNGISKRATNRILRTTLRRIKSKTIGKSVGAKTSTETVLDHAVPLKFIVAEICKGEPSKERIVSILDQFLVSVKLTRQEHTSILHAANLAEDMPSDWDGKDCLARYKRSGIEIELD